MCQSCAGELIERGGKKVRDLPPRIGDARERRQVAGASDRAARWEFGCLEGRGRERRWRTEKSRSGPPVSDVSAHSSTGPVELWKTGAVLSRSHSHTRRFAEPRADPPPRSRSRLFFSDARRRNPRPGGG
jgi:hypothetical protein